MISAFRSVLRGDAAVDWLQPLPHGAPVHRVDFLVDACRGKRVVHLGFVDEHLLEQKVGEGRWLHARLDETAAELVGLDVEPEGVDWARGHGYEAHTVDLQDAAAVAALDLRPADVVVAGELIEHLDSPGGFLRAARPLLADGGVLVVTTPNAYRTVNFLAPILRQELIHPDHTALFSFGTLRALAARTGYEIVDERYYQNVVAPRPGLAGLVVAAVRRVLDAFGRRMPYWSDGLVVVLRPSGSDSQASSSAPGAASATDTRK